jgi:ABC-type transport system involved in cytochrome c biogenesis permease component
MTVKNVIRMMATLVLCGPALSAANAARSAVTIA